MINKLYFLNIGLMLFCVTALLPARGNKEKNTAEAPRIVQITGIIRLTGSDPFPDLVIRNSDGIEWNIASEESYKLNDLQHQVVIIEGEETKTEIKPKNTKMPVITRLFLQNIRIIQVSSTVQGLD